MALLFYLLLLPTTIMPRSALTPPLTWSRWPGSNAFWKVFNGVFIVCLELVDFLWLVMEPYFKWLPILGLLYVLIPYYNQFVEEDDFDDDDDDGGFDPNAWDFNDDMKR